MRVCIFVWNVKKNMSAKSYNITTTFLIFCWFFSCPYTFEFNISLALCLPQQYFNTYLFLSPVFPNSIIHLHLCSLSSHGSIAHIYDHVLTDVFFRWEWVVTSFLIHISTNTCAIRLFTAYKAPHLTSRRWVNVRNYGSAAEMESISPDLKTSVFATRPPSGTCSISAWTIF